MKLPTGSRARPRHQIGSHLHEILGTRPEEEISLGNIAFERSTVHCRQAGIAGTSSATVRNAREKAEQAMTDERNTEVHEPVKGAVLKLLWRLLKEAL